MKDDLKPIHAGLHGCDIFAMSFLYVVNLVTIFGCYNVRCNFQKFRFIFCYHGPLYKFSVENLTHSRKCYISPGYLEKIRYIVQIINPLSVKYCT
jgi:hypothetical protein